MSSEEIFRQANEITQEFHRNRTGDIRQYRIAEMKIIEVLGYPMLLYSNESPVSFYYSRKLNSIFELDKKDLILRKPSADVEARLRVLHYLDQRAFAADGRVGLRPSSPK
jgi:hypothetical protein